MSNFIKKYSTNYTLVSNIVLTDNELSLRAKGLYAYLFSKPDNWEFHPNVIAKDLKESIGQFRAAVSELIQKGYIVRKQINKNGVFGGIVYEFTDVTVLKNNRVGIEACSEKSEHGCTLTHNNTESISNTDVTSNTDSRESPLYISPQKFEREFEEFWELYPRQRRGNKQKAYKAYIRVIKEKRATSENLLIAVNKYSNSDEVKRGFAKGCEAWLNDDRFNTNYDVKVQKKLSKQEQSDLAHKHFLERQDDDYSWLNTD